MKNKLKVTNIIIKIVGIIINPPALDFPLIKIILLKIEEFLGFA
jgi:hypothetical protein